MKTTADADELLRRYWGHESLRPAQRKAIEAVLAARDTLAILPTGGGKSVCYQIPALLLDGVTLVVSPLIALMEDQVKALSRKGIPAACINSSLPASEIALRLDQAANGALSSCISRPNASPPRVLRGWHATCRCRSWRWTRRTASPNGGTTSARLTARSSGRGISSPFLRSPSRLPLPEKRRPISAEACVLPRISRWCASRSAGKTFPTRWWKTNRSPPSCWNCCGKTRKGAPSCIAVRVPRCWPRRGCWKKTASGRRIPRGLVRLIRSRALRKWIEGEKRVMVATNAFGMGIDKADVRLVVHRYIPPSPEDYFQQAGRAGRDSRPCRAVILYDRKAIATPRRRSSAGLAPEEVLEGVPAALRVLRIGAAKARPRMEIDTFSPEDFFARCPLPEAEVRGGFGYVGAHGGSCLSGRRNPRPPGAHSRLAGSLNAGSNWTRGRRPARWKPWPAVARGFSCYPCPIDPQQACFPGRGGVYRIFWKRSRGFPSGIYCTQ